MFENPPIRTRKTQDAALRRATTLKTGQEVFEEYLTRDGRILEESFGDLWEKDPQFYAQYSPENIAADRARVAAMKSSKGYEKPDSHAIVLENMFSDFVAKGKVFGDGRYAVTQLSESDDMLANGAHCDTLLELEIDGGILNIGIDLTTAVNFDGLNKKRGKCIEGVKSGKFASIKYYQSKLSDAKGKIGMVPVVVAGFDRETLADLCAAMGRGEDISSHRTQFIILDEIIHELGRLVAIAQETRGDDEIADALDYYREVFIGIAEKKKSLRTAEGDAKAKEDKAYKFLTAYF